MVKREFVITFVIFIVIIVLILFISKSGFNTPQLAVADFERLKLPVAESEKFRGEYSVACCGDSEILGNFFIFYNNKYLTGENIKNLSLNEEGVCFKNKCFNVEIADSPKEREQGLMNREPESFGEARGMLFVFEEEGIYSFWMKNTLIYLDMIWISKENGILKVVSIANNVPPCKENMLVPCEVYTPDEKALYVLEVNAGSVSRYGIKIGDEVKMR